MVAMSTVQPGKGIAIKGKFMGLRFRKSIKILPGVRLNLGKSGLTSLTVGPRGASVSVGKRGTYANVGIPGTGLSCRTRLDSGRGTTGNHTKTVKQLDEDRSKYILNTAVPLTFPAVVFLLILIGWLSN